MQHVSTGCPDIRYLPSDLNTSSDAAFLFWHRSVMGGNVQATTGAKTDTVRTISSPPAWLPFQARQCYCTQHNRISDVPGSR